MSQNVGQKTLKTSELEPLGLGLDNHADVFRYQDRILRAFYPGHEAFYAELAAQAVTRELIAEKLLIPIAPSEFQIEGYSMALEQPVLRFPSFPYEWTPSMFKRAAEAILKVNLRLMEHGYCTQDGHPWNVLFAGTTPLFVDFSSIIKLPADGRWVGVEHFMETCLTALKLMEKGYPTATRALLREVKSFPDQGLAEAVLFSANRYAGSPRVIADARKVGRLLSHFGSKALNRLRVRGQTQQQGTPAQVQALLETIGKMDVQPPGEMWSEYYTASADYPTYSGKREELAALRSATPKHAVLDKILARLQPKTLLDIGCNRGVYSQLAALRDIQVVGLDSDELALDKMYRDSVSLGTNAVPLFVNITAPAEPVAFKARPFPTAEERLRSDCVLCLALIHHLVFKPPHLKFPHIADILASFTGKHLVVEYIPFEDKYVQEAIRKRPSGFADRFPWYALENFVAALETRFTDIETFESHPAPRKLLLCRKRG